MEIATRHETAREQSVVQRGAVRVLRRLPVHLAVIAFVLLWSVPTIALIVSSFRPAAEITTSGWWTSIKTPLTWTLDNYDAVLNQRGLGKAFVNSFIHARDGWTGVMPYGLILSAVTVAVMMVSDWFGRAMVYRHGVGVSRSDYDDDYGRRAQP